MSEPRKPRRPSYLDPAALDALGQPSDPIAQLHAAHETAAALLHTGRAAQDPEVTARLVALSDEIGLDTLAELWSSRPARSLPGALWRLYLLREWVAQDPNQAAREYSAGIRFTEPNHAVAGVDPAGPDEIRSVADQILAGVFEGDFAVALERAAAFAHVVASGRGEVSVGVAAVQQGFKLQELAQELRDCADAWRQGELN